MSEDHTIDQLDRAFLRLRRFLSAPPVLPDGEGKVELSALLVVDAAVESAPATVKDIAERLVVTHSTASRLVTAAVEAGVVVRAPAPADRRTMLVEPTPQGLQLLKRAIEFRHARLRRIVDDWNEEEVEAFARLAERFAERSAWR